MSVNVADLLDRQAELEAELRVVGPVDFIRQLVRQQPAPQVLARDTQILPGNRRATRFVYIDADGGQAVLTIFSEVLPDGAPSFSLFAEPVG
ncbi:MAG: hypothetical protein JST54_29965 [Deltaproteobacteria bacterium]|nr:hypothetical protein [Deltaproteobacteria bacterium]